MENSFVDPLNNPLNPHPSSLQNGISNDCLGPDADDIEMIALQRSYTSLKDLIPASPPSTASPTKDSWREIPIKDPLVQHAAWAYLQPMALERDDEDRWWACLKDRCYGLFACFNDVVLVLFNCCLPSLSSYGNWKIE